MKKWFSTVFDVLSIALVPVAIFISLVSIGFSMFTIRSLNPLLEVVDPLNNYNYFFEFKSQSSIGWQQEVREEVGKVTEKTMDELTAMTSGNGHLSTDIIVSPIRFLPVWGSDIRADYFTFDINCQLLEGSCEYFHATQNYHWFSSYRLVESEEYGLDLKLDYFDAFLTIGVGILAILSFLGFAIFAIIFISSKLENVSD
jgi:hypothetical protein